MIRTGKSRGNRRPPPRLPRLPLPGWVVRAGRPLSVRGRVTLAIGVGLFVTSFLIGQQIILRLGVLLAATPLVCLLVVGRGKYELHCTRLVAPARVVAGELARVTVRVYNDATTPSKVLLAEDHLPWASARPRFVLDRIEPAGQFQFVYQTRARVRGRYSLGPISVRPADPFGMVQRGRPIPGTDHLTVIPVVEPLPPLSLASTTSGETDNRPTTQPAQGDDDIRIREYRQGDPLNRIHWGTTARRGELMVRQEEHPRQSRATLVIDVRASAHRGDGPDSSVEWAISACASLTAHIIGRGFAVRVLLDRSVAQRAALPMEIPAAPGAEAPLLDALAVLENAPDAPLREVLKELGRPGTGSLLIAVLGDCTSEEAEDLARRRPGGATGIAFLLRTHTWDRQPKARPTADHTALLTNSGWRVVTVEHGDSLVTAWRAALGGQSDTGAPKGKPVAAAYRGGAA